MLLKIMESLGALRADVQNLKDDQVIERQTGADFRREVRVEIATVKQSVSGIEHAIKPVAAAVEQHTKTIDKHALMIAGFSLFQTRLGTIVGLGVTGFGFLYWFVSHYWAESLAFIRSIFTKA
ncbi:hypothetical protein [Ancylobacter amanitiformis]|uniref:DUF1515 domain-containing protein n=1 Tax=Ancylobacter amanitiformis TaxID=217069 RepID=A0ABU0LQ69_9HYPH|nr:hypothetical protein [Ancylobacter amanitiformis]MDQ0510860.1 hypothetical protein [Ancylobacter amanitiformis]